MNKRTNGQGTVYPIPTPGCPHCEQHLVDHRKHLGRWQAGYVVAGKLVRRNAPNRTEALKLIDGLKLERETGALVVGKPTSTGAYIKTWIDDRDPRLPFSGVTKHAYTSVGGYRRRAALLGPTIDKIRLRDLEPKHVRAAITAISVKGLSKTTIGDCRDFLATVLNSAMRERPHPKVVFNAAALVDSIARDDAEKYFLDEDEAGRFLAAAKAFPRFYSAAIVALHTGPRAGELWAARWRAYDRKNRTLTISESLYWINNVGAKAGNRFVQRERTAATKAPKTEKGNRTIRLGALAVAALDAHRDAEAKRLGRVPHADGFIWTNGRGNAWEHRSVLRDVFYPICEAAGIPYVGNHGCVDADLHDGCPAWLTFHGLRHSAATLALAATKDVVAVSRMLGHASTEFTMDVYGHVLEKQQQDIADYMDRAVHG